MTENEAINELTTIQMQFEMSITEAECGDKDAKDALKDNRNAVISIKTAITALKEIQQYQAIGTVKECREAVEKQKPKKTIPVTSGKFYDLGFRDKCPNCGSAIKVDNIYHYDVCKICGQKVIN